MGNVSRYQEYLPGRNKVCLPAHGEFTLTVEDQNQRVERCGMLAYTLSRV